MKFTKLKGLGVFLAAIIICLFIFINRSNDVYSRNLVQTDFRVVYLEDYSGDNTELLHYVDYTKDSIKCFTKGPIDLRADSYSVDFQYSATTENSLFKIFAADYTNSDNSGGELLAKEFIDPTKSNFNFIFSLDQNVDSVFITLETTDPSFQIGRVTLNGNNYVYNDTFIYCFAVLVFTFAILYILNGKCKNILPTTFMENQIDSSRTALTFFFIGSTAIFVASMPIINDYLLTGHDLFFHMNRIEGLKRGLESGQFPVRIHGGTLNSYGYPNSLFYPELLLYFPAILALFGSSIMTAYKAYLIFLNTLTLFVGYFSFKNFTKSRLLGLTLAIAYLLNPHRLICMYYRAALGETAAITFLPLVIYGLYSIVFGNKKHWLALVIGATGILQSHILSTELTALFAAIFIFLNLPLLFVKDKRWIELLKATIVTFMLNIWFLGPMLVLIPQLGLFVFEHGNAAKPSTFLSSSISYIFSIANITTAGPYMIGWTFLLSLGFYFLYRCFSASAKNKSKLIKFVDQIAVLGVTFVISSTSFFPWAFIENIPLLGTILSSIQFPHRMLTLAQGCLIFVLCANLLLWLKSKKQNFIVCTIITITSIITSCVFYEFVFFSGSYEVIQNKFCYENNIDNMHSVAIGEYLVEGVNTDSAIADPPIIESSNETLRVKNFTRKGTSMSFNYEIEKHNTDVDYIELPITYIPRYTVLVNGVDVLTIKTLEAKVAFLPTEENGLVEVNYNSPLIFRAFEILSIATLIFIIFHKNIFVLKKKKI